jgi:hypothetical protein
MGMKDGGLALVDGLALVLHRFITNGKKPIVGMRMPQWGMCNYHLDRDWAINMETHGTKRELEWHHDTRKELEWHHDNQPRLPRRRSRVATVDLRCCGEVADGRAGYRRWKFWTSLCALATLSTASHELKSGVLPFHETKYSNFLCLIRESRISCTSHS